VLVLIPASVEESRFLF